MCDMDGYVRTERSWGGSVDVDRICFGNVHLQAAVITLGATVQSVSINDGKSGGGFDEIILGFNSVADYLKDDCFIGATVGRYANRIANATLPLATTNGAVTLHQLPANNGPHTLHGGPGGFHRSIWKIAQLIDDDNAVGVTLELISPDGDQGFPGQLRARVSYCIPRSAASLRMVFEGTHEKCENERESAAPPAFTICSLTNHCYWNLSGQGGPTTADAHVLLLDSDFMLEATGCIPTGAIVPLPTPYRPLRDGCPIGVVNAELEKEAATATGLDHCFVVRGVPSSSRRAAVLKDPSTGRCAEVHTTFPGIQLYTGNFLKERRSALCLETQMFPDAPNHAHFPSTRLAVGESTKHETVWKFV